MELSTVDCQLSTHAYDRAFVRLDAYLNRIGISAPPAADVEGLRRLHVAHRETFLFENLAIQTGGRVSVALEDIERKFMDQAGGGYCFEHNTLFAAALREIGFSPIVLLGRVRRGPPDRWCRTHMVLRVAVAGDAWLADVGFGALGLLEPIRLDEDGVSTQVTLDYRLRREGPLWVLSCVGPDPAAPGTSTTTETDLYEFSEDPQTAGDVEVANHYTSTHPNSMFRRNLIMQRTTRHERTMLRHDALTRYKNGGVQTQPVGAAELPGIARGVFGVDLPPGPYVYESYQATGVVDS